VRTLPPPLSHLILIRQSSDACNAKGVWGSGVAKAFKQRYPREFEYYRHYCTTPRAGITDLKQHQSALVGTALLIPSKNSPSSTDGPLKDHLIACLFTSEDFGRKVDSKEKILEATKMSIKDLTSKIEELKGVYGPDVVGECWAVKINSVKFRVDWELTKAVLEEGPLDLIVVDRPGSEDEGDEGAREATKRKMKDNGKSAERPRKKGIAQVKKPPYAGVTKNRKK